MKTIIFESFERAKRPTQQLPKPCIRIVFPVQRRKYQVARCVLFVFRLLWPPTRTTTTGRLTMTVPLRHGRDRDEIIGTDVSARAPSSSRGGRSMGVLCRRRKRSTTADQVRRRRAWDYCYRTVLPARLNDPGKRCAHSRDRRSTKKGKKCSKNIHLLLRKRCLWWDVCDSPRGCRAQKNKRERFVTPSLHVYAPLRGSVSMRKAIFGSGF